MRLNLISDAVAQYKWFYKGMTLSNFNKFKRHRIPGFLSDLEMALIYADMKTHSYNTEPRVVIGVLLDTSQIVDLRHEVDDMCGSWQAKPDNQKLRSGIWWSTSGGHGMRGIYCGQPVDYKVLFVANNPDEFEAMKKDHEVHGILQQNSAIAKRAQDDNTVTWQDFQ